MDTANPAKKRGVYKRWRRDLMRGNLIPLFGAFFLMGTGFLLGAYQNWKLGNWRAERGELVIGLIVIGLTGALVWAAFLSHNPHIWDGTGCADAPAYRAGC